jgi:hypothetical protein
MHLVGVGNELEHVGTRVDASRRGSVGAVMVVAKRVRASAVSEGGGCSRRLHSGFVCRKWYRQVEWIREAR